MQGPPKCASAFAGPRPSPAARASRTLRRFDPSGRAVPRVPASPRSRSTWNPTGPGREPGGTGPKGRARCGGIPEGSAQRLSVDGDRVAEVRAPARNQLQKGVVQPPGVERPGQVGKGVAARNPVAGRHELPKKFLFRPPESRHVDASLAAAHGAKQPGRGHFAEVAARSVAATGSLQPLQKVDENPALYLPQYWFFLRAKCSILKQKKTGKFKSDCPAGKLAFP